eukprot:CAMPEP_0174910258 /NCGR_PEP_ID=MMETSP0167-20121228/71989_1 /TAXON_ID=38298 /ORGANISM="Rhodella maculata, Strain CCMP736" /LENGTH=142 /DNA_ID=CAMNT_0016154469 /DNA_START=326 /DNA_END=754 /DNA_ORIENTATION=-
MNPHMALQPRLQLERLPASLDTARDPSGLALIIALRRPPTRDLGLGPGPVLWRLGDLGSDRRLLHVNVWGSSAAAAGPSGQVGRRMIAVVLHGGVVVGNVGARGRQRVEWRGTVSGFAGEEGVDRREGSVFRGAGWDPPGRG